MPGRKLNEHEQAALLAACAAGRSQRDVAKDFQVSQGTVSRLVSINRKAVPGPENPLSLDWRERHAQIYIKTIDERQPKIQDDAKAVAAAQQGLKGLGLMN